MNDVFFSTPFGSLTSLDRSQRKQYLQPFNSMPSHVQEMLQDLKTGSFFRGLAKQFRLPLDQAEKLAFAVLRVAVGEIELAKLGVTLSAELKLPNDKAQAIAKEIEKELFAPVMLELNQFLEKQKKQSTQQPMGVKNVVDLKNKKP